MRDQRYDILKGIAIVIMVANHAQIPRSIAAFGSMFHMAVFFILAGWFFNPRHCESFRSCFEYWKKRMVRLWWPCVFWSIVFILLRNAFASAHIIHDLSFWETAPAGYDTPLWTRHEVVQQLVLTPLMLASPTPLAGAFWFLQALLYASVGYCVLSWTLENIRLPTLAVQTILAVVFLFWSRELDCKLIALMGGPHTLIAYALLHLGALLRSFDLSVERLKSFPMICVGVGCFAVLFTMSRFATISIAINKYPNPLFLLVASVLGWYLLLVLSSLIRGVSAKVFAYIGSHTMSILLLHYAAFKVVNFAIVFVRDAPISSVANVVSYSYGWYWPLYLAVGVCLPLALNTIYIRFRTICFKRMFNRSLSF